MTETGDMIREGGDSSSEELFLEKEESLRPAGYIGGSSEDEDDSSDDGPLYMGYNINEEYTRDWHVSPDGLWRFRKVEKVHDRDAGYRSWISFEIQCLFRELPVLESFNIRLTHGHGNSLGHYTLLDSGDWKCSGWDAANWLDNASPHCIRFHQTETNETECPDVFVSLPSLSNNEPSMPVRAAFVPGWSLENQEYFPDDLKRNWSKVEVVLHQSGISVDSDAISRIQHFYMDLLGNNAMRVELQQQFAAFFEEYGIF